jgi:hypothetical protein
MELVKLDSKLEIWEKERYIAKQIDIYTPQLRTLPVYIQSPSQIQNQCLNVQNREPFRTLFTVTGGGSQFYRSYVIYYRLIDVRTVIAQSV